MSDDDETAARAFGFEIPLAALGAIGQQHSAERGHALDRQNRGMAWLENLDVEGLLALRWILSCDTEDAYGNSKYFDGMCVILLRAKGVHPNTGLDPAEQLLTEEALRNPQTASGPEPGQ